jgi:phage tail-like protein
MPELPRPFVAFNFLVHITVPGFDAPVCDGAFAECDGLEATMDVKTIREGGNNAAAIRLAGAVGYGQLTLKRGMTERFDVWSWMTAVVTNPALRGKCDVIMRAPDRTDRARFVLERCLPVKVKAPPLNAKDGMVAIEELGVAYERLTLKPPLAPAGGGARA